MPNNRCTCAQCQRAAREGNLTSHMTGTFPVENWATCDEIVTQRRRQASEPVPPNLNPETYALVRGRRQGDYDHWFLAAHDSMADTKHQYIYGDRRYGVELESRTKHIRMTNTAFGAVRDGSIEGQEFVSPILQGDAGYNIIKELCALPRPPMADDRCGFHLHLDATKLSWWDVVQIAQGYTIIQPLIFEMVPDRRRTNETCKMIMTPYFLISTKEMFLRTMYGREPSLMDARSTKYARKRYEWLNLHSYFYHHTLEIRLAPGTFDPEYIRQWINMHMALFEYFLKNRVQIGDNPFVHFNRALKDHPDVIKYWQATLPKDIQDQINDPTLYQSEYTITDPVPKRVTSELDWAIKLFSDITPKHTQRRKYRPELLDQLQDYYGRDNLQLTETPCAESLVPLGDIIPES